MSNRSLSLIRTSSKSYRFCYFIAVLLIGGAIGCTTDSPNIESQSSAQSERPLEQTEGEAGIAYVPSTQEMLQTRRDALADMVQQVSAYSNEQWLQSFQLTERSGKVISDRDLIGQPYIASFFFSLCPTICVQQNDQMKLLSTRLRDLPVRFVSITCDPENDTPARLTEYAKRFNADPEQWLFLTGEFDYLKRVSAEVFFHALHRPREHIEKFLLMDSDGKIVNAYNWHSSEELEMLERDVRKLLELESIDEIPTR